MDGPLLNKIFNLYYKFFFLKKWLIIYKQGMHKSHSYIELNYNVYNRISLDTYYKVLFITKRVYSTNE